MELYEPKTEGGSPRVKDREGLFECIQTILSLLRYCGSSANYDSFISLLSCISKVKF